VDLFDLSGKTAVIFGCFSEVLKATVCALATAGANVVAVSKDKTLFEPLERDLTNDGYVFELIEREITDGKSAEQIISQVYGKYGRVDILVNQADAVNSSYNIDADQISDYTWDNMVSEGLKKAFFSIRAVLPYMIKAGKGKIVNIASYTGRIGFEFTGVHASVLSGGLTAMTRQLGLQYADKGININAIAPGPLESNGTGYNEQQLELILRKTPLKRLCRPQDVAAAVLYLVSATGDYCVGETVNINGGLYMV